MHSNESNADDVIGLHCIAHAIYALHRHKAFQVPTARLRCDGSGVTQSSDGDKNRTVLNVGSVRHTVRAPSNGSEPWEMRLTVLTMPYRSATNFHGVWPVGKEDDGGGAGGALQAKGRVYTFTHTFPPHKDPPNPSCSPASPMVACFRPRLPNTKECFRTVGGDQSACSIPYADVIIPDPAGRGFLVGGKDVLARVDSKLSTVENVVTVSADYSRVLAAILSEDADSGGSNGGNANNDADNDADNDDDATDSTLLYCGTGKGRPHCSLRSATTLELKEEDAPGWVATGVVARTPSASYGVLIRGGSVYAARNQVKVPTEPKSAANVISRSLLADTAGWVYHYDEIGSSSGGGGGGGSGASTNNGLHRSTSIDEDVDRPWLEQPSPLSSSPSGSETDPTTTTFTSPWSKTPSDGYIYFGLAEYDPSSKSIKSRIARVCEKESAPPDGNNFASFLKMEVSCNGGVYALETSRITSAIAGKGIGEGGSGGGQGTTAGVVYLAFQTAASKSATSDAPGAVVCAFGYAAEPHGIDYEMNGLVDVELNQNSFFSKVSGKPFSCERSADDARTLVYVNPEQQADGYSGKAHSTDVVLESVGAGKEFLHMATHSAVVAADGTSVEVLWAIEKNGLVRKVAMVEGEAFEVLAVESGVADATSFVVDRTSSSVLVGSAAGITRLQSEHCGKQATCRECAELGDPDCGWCAAESICSTRSECTGSATNWKLDLKDRAGNDFCKAPPDAASFEVVATTATEIEVAITDAGASASLYDQPTYSAIVNDVQMAFTLRDGSIGSHIIEGLQPFTAYKLAVDSINEGGRARTRSTQDVKTDAAAPSQLAAPPSVTAVSSTSILVGWTSPLRSNGDVVSYQVLRDGNRVCCDSPVTSFNDNGLVPYTAYAYTVAAETKDSEGNMLVGDRTPSVAATTFESVPQAMAAPRAANVTSTSITVAWMPPDVLNGALTGYSVRITRVDVDGVDADDGDADADAEAASSFRSTVLASETFGGLLPNTEYSVAVQAFTAAGAGPIGAEVKVVTLQGLPGATAAPEIVLNVGSTTSTTVTWNAPEEINAPAVQTYVVQRWIPKADSDGVIVAASESSPGAGADTGEKEEVYSGADTSFEDTDLEPCTLYFYNTVAHTEAGSGPVSTVGRIRTGTPRPLEAPPVPSLTRYENTFGTAVVAWEVGPACDAVSFKVEHWEKGSTDGVESMPITSAGQTKLSALLPGSVHYVTLRSVHREANEGSSGAAAQLVESPPSEALEIIVPEVCSTATTASPTTATTVPSTILFTAAPVVTVEGETTTSVWSANTNANDGGVREHTSDAGEGCGGNATDKPSGTSSSSSPLAGRNVSGNIQQCTTPVVVAAVVAGVSGVIIAILLCILRRKTHSRSHALTIMPGSGIGNNDNDTTCSNSRASQRHSGPIGASWEEGAHLHSPSGIKAPTATAANATASVDDPPPAVTIDGIGDGDGDRDDYLTVEGEAGSEDGAGDEEVNYRDSARSATARPDSMLEDSAATSAKMQDAMMAHSTSNLLNETSFSFREMAAAGGSSGSGGASIDAVLVSNDGIGDYLTANITSIDDENPDNATTLL